MKRTSKRFACFAEEGAILAFKIGAVDLELELEIEYRWRSFQDVLGSNRNEGIHFHPKRAGLTKLLAVNHDIN